MGSCMDMAETAAVTVKGAKLRNIIELPFGNQVIKIKQEFYSEKNLMHKICKEPIPKTFLATNFVHVYEGFMHYKRYNR